MQLFIRIRNLTGWLTVTVLLGIWLAGCGSAPQVSQHPDSSELSLFEHLSAEEESQAIIYLYRPSFWSSGNERPWVTFNGQKVVVLQNNQFTRLAVEPGPYMIQTELSSNLIGVRSVTAFVSIEKGKIYFLRISLDFEWNFGNLVRGGLIDFLSSRGPLYPLFGQIPKMELVDKSIAIPELKKTNFISPL